MDGVGVGGWGGVGGLNLVGWGRVGVGGMGGGRGDLMVLGRGGGVKVGLWWYVLGGKKLDGGFLGGRGEGGIGWDRKWW